MWHIVWKSPKKSHLNLIINAVHPLVFTVIISMHIRCIDMKALGNDGWTLKKSSSLRSLSSIWDFIAIFKHFELKGQNWGKQLKLQKIRINATKLGRQTKSGTIELNFLFWHLLLWKLGCPSGAIKMLPNSEKGRSGRLLFLPAFANAEMQIREKCASALELE